MFHSFQATKASSEETTASAKSSRPPGIRRITTSNACGIEQLTPCSLGQLLTSRQDPADGGRFAAMGLHPAASVYTTSKQMLVRTRSHLHASYHPRIEDLAASVERYRLVFQRLFPGRDIEQLASLSKDDLVTAIGTPQTAIDTSTRASELGSPTSTLESEGADSLETLIQAPEQDPVADEATRHQTRVQGISDDVNGLSLSLDRPSSYVGVSSITAALKVICRVAPATRRLLALGQPETALPSRTGSPSLNLEHLDPMYTPPADVGHVLIEAYFSKVHPLMPMLDEQQFWQIWLYGERRDSAWLALLNTVLALGSVMSSDCTSSAHEAYYQRAMQLLDLDSLGSGNTLVVQALGLLSGYYTTTGRPSLGQPSKGITVRVPNVPDVQDPETAKFLPLVYNVQFCRIATQIQDALCATPILPFDELNRLDRELLQWHMDLPASLKLDASSNGSSQPSLSTKKSDATGILATTSMIMHWRYQNLRLLLHRPYLLATALRSGSDATLSAEEKVGVGRCRAVAARTISDISSMCLEDSLAGWNGVWFMYQAVMVPLVCVFSSLGKSQPQPMETAQEAQEEDATGKDKAGDKARTRDQTGLQEWQAQIEQALQYFERMTRWSTTAKKSRDVVSRLYEASKHLADQEFRSRFSAREQFLQVSNQPPGLDPVATNRDADQSTLENVQTSMATSNLLTEDIWGLSPNGAAAMNNFWFDDMMWDIPAADTDMFDNTGTGFAYNELDWLSSLNYQNGGDQGWQYQPQ
ncbi:hypothetical protein E4T39_03604 [Aureobasidium subglaciale]|nr:hypothetical protein E4T39_03604 [Aureobasidium subglaciale]